MDWDSSDSVSKARPVLFHAKYAFLCIYKIDEEDIEICTSQMSEVSILLKKFNGTMGLIAIDIVQSNWENVESSVIFRITGSSDEAGINWDPPVQTPV